MESRATWMTKKSRAASTTRSRKDRLSAKRAARRPYGSVNEEDARGSSPIDRRSGVCAPRSDGRDVGPLEARRGARSVESDWRRSNRKRRATKYPRLLHPRPGKVRSTLDHQPEPATADPIRSARSQDAVL